MDFTAWTAKQKLWPCEYQTVQTTTTRRV